jgi:endonuclease-3
MLIKKERLALIINGLKKLYPKTKTALSYGDAFQLLCAVILSAQCTDTRVNMLTPVLFKKYPTAQAMAKADLRDIEKIIKSAGFYHSKALSIKESAKRITYEFGGKVPDNIEDLLTLRGVARKTANVVLQDFYGISVGVVVDTHVKRLSYRIGLTKNTDPVLIEKDLMKLFSQKDWHWLSHALIWHGRKVCTARKLFCDACVINRYCMKNGL